MPLVTCESGFVVRVMERAQNLFLLLIRGAHSETTARL